MIFGSILLLEMQVFLDQIFNQFRLILSCGG